MQPLRPQSLVQVPPPESFNDNHVWSLERLWFGCAKHGFYISEPNGLRLVISAFLKQFERLLFELSNCGCQWRLINKHSTNY